MNYFQRNRFSKLIITTLLNTLRDKSIAILGFSYKKDTADTRETPACYVAHALLDEGAILRIYDPKVPREAVLNEMS